MKLKLKVLALAGVCLGAVAGCSSDDPAPVVNVAGTGVPVVATTSSESASIFIKGIVLAGGLDNDEPLVVGDVVLATSETDDVDASI